MPDTLTESEISSLREAAGRVEALTAERDTAIAERDTSRHELAVERAGTAAVTRARARVVQANAGLAPTVVDRIVAEATRTVPLTEAGALDETALDTATDTARTAEETYIASLRPAGVTGFGSVNVNETGDPTAELDELDRIATRTGLRAVPKGA